MGYTRFTNLEVTGSFRSPGLGAAANKVTENDAAAAAGSAPTKAEFDAVVDLANDLKAKFNALVDKLGGE